MLCAAAVKQVPACEELALTENFSAHANNYRLVITIILMHELLGAAANNACCPVVIVRDNAAVSTGLRNGSSEHAT